MNQPGRPALVLSAAALVGAACCSGAVRGGAPSQPVILIGMRGAGKTTLGKGAAQALGLEFEDLDETLETHVGMTCREFVAAHGWTAFRSKELEVLAASLAPQSSAGCHNRMLACGGGVVESADAMALLRAWQGGTIVWIDRPIDAIIQAFGGDAGRPWGGLDEVKLREIFSRRKPLYEQACHHRFAVPACCDVAEAIAELCRWLRQSKDEGQRRAVWDFGAAT